MEQFLYQWWVDLLGTYDSDKVQTDHLWEDIRKRYEHKSRAYHNLFHLQQMLDGLKQFEKDVEMPDVVRFAIWYHDIVYHPLRQDNEKQSARYARTVLQQLSLPVDHVERCCRQIMYTKNHLLPEEASFDEQILIDLDLDVLGSDWKKYTVYSQQIRKEYWMYPSAIYKKGRRAALQQFLERPYIYQTPFFRIHREDAARVNIKREIEELLN